MTPFENYLLKTGFTPYRSSDNGFIKCPNNGFYSTQPNGGIYFEDTFFKKDELIIVFGIGWMAKGIPPTIKIFSDPSANANFVKENTPETILQLCIDKAFKYDQDYLSKFK